MYLDLGLNGRGIRGSSPPFVRGQLSPSAEFLFSIPIYPYNTGLGEVSPAGPGSSPTARWRFAFEAAESPILLNVPDIFAGIIYPVYITLPILPPLSSISLQCYYSRNPDGVSGKRYKLQRVR